MAGLHQARNAALAFAAGRLLGVAPDAIARGLAEVELPARLERVASRPTVVVDSCHTPDSAAMDDLLNKLTGLRAASFAEGSTRTGLEKPALIISASFDSGKFERVRFGLFEDRLQIRKRLREHDDRQMMHRQRHTDSLGVGD